MSILFSDLDNTLIYSHHRKIGTPKIVIEYLNGQEQSFMTRFTYDFLASADWLSVIPITTRTENQFKRIEFPDRLGFKYAIVCNGGKLLIDGKEDEAWSAETRDLAQGSYDCLEEATNQLIQLCKNETVHRPEEYMCYVKCSDPEMVYSTLSESVDSTKVTVQRNGRKLYLFANGVTKGNAVERFMKGNHETVLAAGDGLLDISMLNKADFAFSGRDVYELVTNDNNIKIKERILSDELCKHIYEMRMKGII